VGKLRSVVDTNVELGVLALARDLWNQRLLSLYAPGPTSLPISKLQKRRSVELKACTLEAGFEARVWE
jgi:hypothetical protein